jgi:short-subunit dehydrogenase
VAPADNELQELRAELTSVYGISAEIIAKDLEQPQAGDEIHAEIIRRRLPVDILVNNAGHGFHGKWADQTIENDLSMIRLNIEAVLRLTKKFLPQMVAAGSGRLLITASVAGFEAGPTMAVYHATKAFILSWTEALSIELKDSGVSITALCPGPTDTDFFPKAGMEGAFAFQKGNLMAPQEVVETAYKGLMDGDLIVIPGAINKALVQGRRLLTEKAQAQMNDKMYQEVPPEERERSRGDIEKEYASQK